jgi:FG-GAP-like repeat
MRGPTRICTCNSIYCNAFLIVFTILTVLSVPVSVHFEEVFMRHNMYPKFLIFLGVMLASAFGVTATRAWAQDPTPFINELSPVSAHLDGPTFALTVRGTGFTSRATVDWKVGANATALVTTFVSGTELIAKIPSSLITTQATTQVWVRNADLAPEIATSNVQFFPITVPSPFPAFTPIDLNGVLGNLPFSTVTGDFNGDGNQDLAVCSFGGVSILLGNGDGSFTPAPSLPSGSQPYAIATGDFNADGSLDLAVPGGSAILIYLGNGDGTFTAAPTLTIPGAAFWGVVVGDFNRDGKTDLVVTDPDSNAIRTLLGNGDGTFTQTQVVFVGSGTDENQQLVMGDFDGNGTLDVAVLTNGQPVGTVELGAITILLGQGDGSFDRKTAFPAGYVFLPQGDSTSLGVGDFNNDGKLDLAVSGCSTSTDCNVLTTLIFLGNGDGTFSAKSSSPVGGGTMSVGDINGDGILDLAFPGHKGVSFMLGNGNGTFTTEFPPYGEGYSLSLVAADFNNDGRLDLAAAGAISNNLVTLLQQPPALTATPAEVNFGSVQRGLGGFRDVTLTNTSNATVNLASITVSTPGNDPRAFIVGNSCPSSLAAGGSCQVSIRFVAGGGRPTATLKVSYGVFGSPLLVPLSGQVK